MVNDGDVDVPVREKISRQVLHEPLVLVDVLGRGSPHRVGLEHVAEQAHDALVQVVRNGKDSGCKTKAKDVTTWIEILHSTISLNGRGLHSTMVSVLASHPAAPGSILSVPEIAEYNRQQH